MIAWRSPFHAMLSRRRRIAVGQDVFAGHIYPGLKPGATMLVRAGAGAIVLVRTGPKFRSSLSLFVRPTFSPTIQRLVVRRSSPLSSSHHSLIARHSLLELRNFSEGVGEGGTHFSPTVKYAPSLVKYFRASNFTGQASHFTWQELTTHL